MPNSESTKRAEREFVEEMKRQAGAFEPRGGDTYMLAGHVAGDMILLGDMSVEAALTILRRSRARGKEQ